MEVLGGGPRTSTGDLEDPPLPPWRGDHEDTRLVRRKLDAEADCYDPDGEDDIEYDYWYSALNAMTARLFDTMAVSGD